MKKKNILIVYAGFPTRATLADSLYSFRRYSEHNIYYLNLRLRKVPWYIRTVDFDLIIFHTLFFISRWDSPLFKSIIKRTQRLINSRAPKAILPQDEFINSNTVNHFINHFDISYVFSVQPETEWRSIYDDVNWDRVQFFRILTGYLDTRRLVKIDKMAKDSYQRNIDIGYRTADRPRPWFGRHGLLKEKIAHVFSAKTRLSKLKVDISTRREDTLTGNDWYRFLLRCKYTIGVEGGTSILDRDGSIRMKTEEYCAAHPHASFDEIEQHCFPGIDGAFRGYALSPRHLEACATRTCQILTEGEYNGILLPDTHYIRLKKDFSNIDDVLSLVSSDNQRQEITERAYKDIVGSEAYTYQEFVKFVLGNTIKDINKDTNQNRKTDWYRKFWYVLVYRWLYSIDVVEQFLTVVRRTRIIMRIRQMMYYSWEKPSRT